MGSLERFIAILTEHYEGGKWPFWISPRQLLVCPVSEKFAEQGKQIAEFFSDF